MCRLCILLLFALLASSPARADVVINEIFYHAPDDLHEVQFIELHNTTERAVDLAGWKLAKGTAYTFPAKTTLAAGGYLVISRNPKAFQQVYRQDANGPFAKALNRKKGVVELLDATGKLIDRAQYGSRAPWPLAADGYSSSLERICPTSPGDQHDNWAPSPLASGTPRPAGSPGKKNTTFATHLPPVISNVTFTPGHAAVDQEVKVSATVKSQLELTTVEVRYRVAGPGYEKEEKSLAMTRAADGRYTGTIPGQKADQILRFRIHAVDVKKVERFHPAEHDVRPALSLYVSEKQKPDKIPFGQIVHVDRRRQPFRMPWYGAPPAATPSARGPSAFVYTDVKTGTTQLFDFINVMPRSGGHRLRFHKDRPLGNMRTVALIYEPVDRFVLAEPLAYEVYRKAGLAAPQTDFVRTWVDGRPLGFQLLIEQPNRSFLKNNKLNNDGNLYKAVWFGHNAIARHEKKTNIHAGHDDLVQVLDELNKTKDDKQWAVIKKNFDVEQMAKSYAVRMLLSDWDGFFNNYFIYHDVKGTGKWTLYPWDQDKTWGHHDGTHSGFTDMPLTFGMAGDLPPGWPRNRPAPGVLQGGPIWWRPGGDFSKPLLANPGFRTLFLTHTKELAEKVYNEKVVFPLIKSLGERIEEEVKVRAELRREDRKQALARLQSDLESLREHLTKRRKFVLEQDELKK